MKKVLIGYLTHTGTTTDVAEAISEEMRKNNFEAETKALDQVNNLSEYDAIVIGAPMILGWHQEAQKFIQRNKVELEKKPMAIFMTAMNLVDSPRPELNGIDLHVDPNLVAAPKKPGRLSFKERFTTFSHYLAPVLKIAPKSLSAIAFFGGRLDMYRLKFFDAAFVMLVVGAKPGEKRNWADIRAWAAGLPALLKLS